MNAALSLSVAISHLWSDFAVSSCHDCGCSVPELKARCEACARVSVGMHPRVGRRSTRKPNPLNRGSIPLREALALTPAASRRRFDLIVAHYDRLPPWQQAIVRAVVEERTAEIRKTKEPMDAESPYVEPAELRELRAVVNRVGISGLNTTQHRAYWRLIQRKRVWERGGS